MLVRKILNLKEGDEKMDENQQSQQNQQNQQQVTQPETSQGSTSTTQPMAENVAAALSYVLGIISGIVFLLIDKREFVRFHAAQSTVFCALWIILVALLPWTIIGAVLVPLVSLIGLGLWVILIIKAYQGELFKLPLIADWAEKLKNAIKVS